MQKPAQPPTTLLLANVTGQRRNWAPRSASRSPPVSRAGSILRASSCAELKA